MSLREKCLLILGVGSPFFRTMILDFHTKRESSSRMIEQRKIKGSCFEKTIEQFFLEAVLK